VLIDADAVAREVVDPGTPGLAEVAGAFGPEVLRGDGSLDRDKLGSMVFADPALRGKLNAIVHPLVGARMTELEDAAPAGSIIVHDVPLLAENGLAGAYDVVVVVDAPPQLQLDRLVRIRGMAGQQAEARMAAQASRERRLAAADIVLDNSGSLAELDRQVADLWTELRRRARSRGAPAEPA
jgi:dephospho-CoA kinase